jgi:hypothetical protein
VVARARLRPESSDPLVAAADEARYERLFEIGLWLAVAGAVLQGLAHLVNVFAFDGDSWNLDAEADNNAWAWASSVATFTCAFILVVLATLRRGPTRHLWFLALVLAFFSVDDLVKVHEQVGTRFRDDVLGLPTGWGRLAWPAIFFPLLAGVFLLLWRLSREAMPRAGRWIRAGLGMLVAAVLLELASAPWYISGRSAHSVPGTLEVVVEEGLELAAWIAIATALTVVLLESAKKVSR